LELENKNVVVVGLARSGVCVVKYLAQSGARATVTDIKTEAELSAAVDEIKSAAAGLALGGHPQSIFEHADLVVVSPGVPKDMPQLAQAQKRGVQVLSELAFAAGRVSAPVIAVTGTNGKSTVVSLIGEIMKRALGEECVFVGGNIGNPLTELLLSRAAVKAVVIEVSSFQLEFAPALHPKIAVMLNITADHLDRYRDFQEYAETKWRIFANQEVSDYAVINADDPVVEKMASDLSQKVMAISLQNETTPGMRLLGDVLEYRGHDGVREQVPVSDVPLHGRHNLMNVMAAYCAARSFGVEPDHIRSAVKGFKGLSHRLELIRELNGIKIYNDSKATNAGAVEAAVAGLDDPVVLLMGGQAKGCSFVELADRIRDRVKQIVAFGECRDQLVKEMSGAIPVAGTHDLAEALKRAMEAADSGDAVVLAPGCASFDQFESYKERGEVFRRLVKGVS
jgi:UDP-N-acetylmuramoylalanine--D-glutamate ligase